MTTETGLFTMPNERTMHLLVTPEEEAVVQHVRGNCHNSAICYVCTLDQRWLQERARATAAEDRQIAAVRRANRAETSLNTIITGHDEPTEWNGRRR